jgi:putative hydrolase of the HAD superfamily
MIRAVLFDLDGVVRNFDRQYVIEIEERHHLATGTIEQYAFSSPLIDQVTTGRMSRRDWVATIGTHVGNPDAAEEWGRQPFESDRAVLDLADELRALGLATAILTNGTDTIPYEAERLGLHHHFDQIFNSATIGYAKPDARAFTHVLDSLGLAGREVFFTDDSPAKLEGGAAVGMITHHFTGVNSLRTALRESDVAVDR